MDEPSLIMGRSHRCERHDPIRDLPIVIRLFGNEYGEELAKQIFIDHIYLDTKERTKSKNDPEPAENYLEDYPELSQSSPVYSSYHTFWSDIDVVGIVKTICVIFLGIVVLWALNGALGDPIGSWWINNIVNPIGFWWSQNWVIVVGVVVALPFLLVTIYAFRNKNKVAKTLWNLID